MGLRVTVLGSGSAGNSILVSSSTTHVLVDIGLSGKETAARLNEVGVAPEAVAGILVTHEHSDHIKGLCAFTKSLKTPVYMSPLALAASGMKDGIARWEQIESGIPFEIGDLKIIPFSTPHDAVDPLAYTIEADGLKVTTVTDIGYMSALIKDRLAKSDCIVVEANHDVEMLKVGPYPWALKQRILGRHGHLSNDALAEYLANEFDGYARYIFLAHLSRTNNHPEIAKITAERALKSRAELFEQFNIKLKLTYQDRPSETAEL